MTDSAALSRLLHEVDVVLSAVPYYLNLDIARIAIESRTHMCDLGGNTDLVRRQLDLDADARAAGVTLVPDCGQVPGMGTTLMVRAMRLLEEPVDVMMWDGGIPQTPVEPWNYALTFNVEGLTNEYAGDAVFLRQGERTSVPCFDPSGYELVDFQEPFGTLEAFVTAGGTSTLPWTLEGRIERLENRTLRYPGHAAQWKAYADAGLLGLEPIEVGDRSVVPRQLLHTLMDPRLAAPEDYRDAVLVRVIARGHSDKAPAETRIDLVDMFDEATGFSAMQRTTGWDAAIVAAMMAHGETAPGAAPRELSIDPADYMKQLDRRGFDVRESTCPVDPDDRSEDT